MLASFNFILAYLKGVTQHTHTHLLVPNIMLTPGIWDAAVFTRRGLMAFLFMELAFLFMELACVVASQQISICI